MRIDGVRERPVEIEDQRLSLASRAYPSRSPAPDDRGNGLRVGPHDVAYGSFATRPPHEGIATAGSAP